MGWQNNPFPVEVKAGETKSFCACGLTKRPPFCDGHHAGTGKKPYVQKFDEDKTVYICGCQQSANRPFCDGTHKTLTGK